MEDVDRPYAFEVNCSDPAVCFSLSSQRTRDCIALLRCRLYLRMDRPYLFLRRIVKMNLLIGYLDFARQLLKR